jgi:hypothetical protein
VHIKGDLFISYGIAIFSLARSTMICSHVYTPSDHLLDHNEEGSTSVPITRLVNLILASAVGEKFFKMSITAQQISDLLETEIKECILEFRQLGNEYPCDCENEDCCAHFYRLPYTFGSDLTTRAFLVFSRRVNSINAILLSKPELLSNKKEGKKIGLGFHFKNVLRTCLH